MIMGVLSMKLIQKGSKPLYLQLKDAIKKEIDEGIYPIGSQLPTESELCDLYGVSRITTRRAIEELVNEGLIQKQHGIGTFISDRKIARELVSVNGFSEFLSQLGKNPSSVILSKEVIEPSMREAEFLEIEEGELVLEVCRLHLIEDNPIHLESCYYPLSRFPDLEKHLEESSFIYRILKDKYNIEAASNKKILNTINPTVEQTQLLQCSADIPLFEVLKIAYDKDKKPIHFSKSLLPGNKISFTITAEGEL
jgi:GntR family transcriptional regulator, frlABCD operon transcriptional regulator